MNHDLERIKITKEIYRRSYDEASRELDRQKDALLDEISQRLEQRSDAIVLFTIRWGLQ